MDWVDMVDWVDTVDWVDRVDRVDRATICDHLDRWGMADAKKIKNKK